MNIYLVRHIKTDWNINGKFMGQDYDPPISQASIDTETGFIALLSNIHLDNVYSSPALRCKQTAKLLSQDISLQEDSRLFETDMGVFTGLNIEEVKAKYPEEYAVWQENTDQHRFPNGESYSEVQMRSMNFLEQVSTSAVENIAVFTHVDIIKMMVCGVMNIPLTKKNYFFIANGSVTKLRFDDRYGFRLEFMNART